jgi:hypothetical protein
MHMDRFRVLPLVVLAALMGVGHSGAQPSPIEARIDPLGAPVMAGQSVTFTAVSSVGEPETYEWDFGDGKTAAGGEVRHTFAEPGAYRIVLQASDGRHRDQCSAIVRVHTPETLHVPQVVLETDQKNEQDDQHYLAYALFSELDVLAVNSVHHGGGQEAINYGEILHVVDLARKSGLPEHREPPIFRGADSRLAMPSTGQWEHTRPIVTQASEAILAAARGAWPGDPVWIVPVGPGTNVASAILQARAEGLELEDRLRVMWLGGSNTAVTGEFNGDNDPWSIYVIAQSGLQTWILPAPVGARVSIDKRTEGHLYADHPLGQYLEAITPARWKALFDPSCLSAIISMRLGLGWVRAVEGITIAGGDDHRYTKSDAPAAVRVIREIDHRAMKLDLFQTIKGRPRRLIGEPMQESAATAAVK